MLCVSMIRAEICICFFMSKFLAKLKTYQTRYYAIVRYSLVLGFGLSVLPKTFDFITR